MQGGLGELEGAGEIGGGKLKPDDGGGGCFFFSRRRRHTRFKCDWSSDVCSSDLAVDPAFKLSERSRRLADSKARVTHYFETTSDSFFSDQAAFLEERPIDVALIDGLHTYEQVVRDVESTVRYLKDDGVIFLHDCNPALELIGRRAETWEDFVAQQKGPL